MIVRTEETNWDFIWKNLISQKEKNSYCLTGFKMNSLVFKDKALVAESEKTL